MKSLTKKMEKRSKRDGLENHALHIGSSDIAKLAGVSRATVSRVINGNSKVNPELSERVWKAAKEAGYVPNPQARALASGRSRTLGLIISDITNPFFPELVREFENQAETQGYEVMIGSTNNDRARSKSIIRRMLQRKIEGIAIMTFGIEDDYAYSLVERKYPIVFVDSAPNLQDAREINANKKDGIRQAVLHLAALGHRSIAFVSGPLQLPSALARRDAFLRSLAELRIQIPEGYVVEGDHTIDGGMAAVEKIMALSELPTAVMCSNDMTAIGVLHGLHRTVLDVPEDISVVGFDDIHLAQFALPPLTTVQVSCKDLASAAIEALRAAIEPDHPCSEQRKWQIPARLIVRQSTTFPRGSLPSRVLEAARIKIS